ncbi:ABC transporter substrate-binding protein [Synergistales bacterium]|nr:ABC transporter substrate-binding protein [Synergistales bacterium]
MVTAWETQGLDPLLSGFAFLRMGSVEVLVRSDRKGGVEPCLAEKWSLSDDRLTWKFDIRPNVLFHDGTPLTAAAAARSLNRTLSKGAIFKGTPVKTIESDGNSVVIKTSSPFAPLPWYLATYSTVVLAPSSFDKNDECVSVVGTGFYKLLSSEGNTVFDFEAFDGYWGEKAAIEKARYLAVPNPETRAMMAESGEGHIVIDLPAESAQYLAEDTDVIVVSQILPRVRSMILNANRPVFADAKLRQAVSLCIDRKGIAEAIHKDVTLAATQLLADFSPWHDKNLSPLEYNPEKARGIFMRLGWKPNKSGVLEKDGKEFAFEILTYTARPDLPVVAQAIQQQLANVGIKVSIAIDNSSVIASRHNDGTLESALLGRNYSSIPDPIGNIAADFSEPRDPMGAMNWRSEKAESLIKGYMGASNPQDAAKARSGIMAILQEELPVVPVSWYANQSAFSKNLENVNLDPYELRPYPEGVRWKK